MNTSADPCQDFYQVETQISHLLELALLKISNNLLGLVQPSLDCVKPQISKHLLDPVQVPSQISKHLLDLAQPQIYKNFLDIVQPQDI